MSWKVGLVSDKLRARVWLKQKEKNIYKQKKKKNVSEKYVKLSVAGAATSPFKLCEKFLCNSCVSTSEGDYRWCQFGERFTISWDSWAKSDSYTGKHLEVYKLKKSILLRESFFHSHWKDFWNIFITLKYFYFSILFFVENFASQCVDYNGHGSYLAFYIVFAYSMTFCPWNKLRSFLLFNFFLFKFLLLAEITNLTSLVSQFFITILG